MSQAAPTNSGLLFQTLASSGGALDALVDYWKELLKENVEKQNELAVHALCKPELVSVAQIQVGKCQMLQELIDHANTFK